MSQRYSARVWMRYQYEYKSKTTNWCFLWGIFFLWSIPNTQYREDGMSKKKIVFYSPSNTELYYSKYVSKYLARSPIQATALVQMFTKKIVKQQKSIVRLCLERTATLYYI